MDTHNADRVGRWVLSTVAGALVVWVLVHLRPVPALLLGVGVAVGGMVIVVGSERRKPGGRPLPAFVMMLALLVAGGLAGWLLVEFQGALFTS